MKKRLLKATLVLAGPGLIIALLINATPWLIDHPQAQLDHAIASIRRDLSQQGRLIGLLTFDEPVPREWATGRHLVQAPGTVCVPTRCGAGRKFDGRERTHIDTTLRWHTLGSNYTIALRLTIRPGSHTQDILCGSGGNRLTGFRLIDGKMTFDVPADNRQAAAYPFQSYGKPICLAATVDSHNRTLRLYEDGRLMASNTVETVSWSHYNISFGKPLWYSAQHPFHGIIDEAVFMTGVLSPAGIRRLTQSRRGFLRHFTAPRRYARWRYARNAADAAALLHRLIDAFKAPVLRLGLPRSATPPLPVLGLHLSGADQRHFLRAHQRSRLSGRRTQPAARSRRIHARFGGRVSEARLFLDGSDIAYGTSPRPSFMLELPDTAPCFGTTRLRLQPPETAGHTTPFLLDQLRRRCGLPTATNGFCRLMLNGNDYGCYIFEDFTRDGVLPGDTPDIASGNVRRIADFGSIFTAVATSRTDRLIHQHPWPLTRAELLALHDEVADEVIPLIAGDTLYPESLDLLQRHLQEERRRVAETWPAADPALPPAQRWARFLNPFMFLGRNLSPDRLTEPLNLHLPAIPGMQVTWHSSQPDVIDPHTGHITRPDDNSPVLVELTAEVDDGTNRATRILSLRVMPRHIPLPTVALHIRDAVVKTRRVDAIIEICDTGEDQPSRRLHATQGGRGGVNHRGNTSYWYAKKLLTLKFDEPHQLFGDNARLTARTINSMQDPGFQNNMLAFDLFRAFGTPEAPRYAPHVLHAEFYVNGAYQGLFELCTRLDEELVPGKGLIVYRHENLKPRLMPFRAARPPRRDGDFMAPFLELQQTVDTTPPGDWINQIGRHIDFASVIDYQLLLNVMQNHNGEPFKFWFHDALIYQPGSQPPFAHVPWDFDRGLNARPWSWIENDLMRRMATDLPGYRQRCAARWRLLRAGPLADEAVDERLARQAAILVPYIAHDHRRWNYGYPDAVAAALEGKRTVVLRNLHEIDRLMDTAEEAAEAHAKARSGE